VVEPIRHETLTGLTWWPGEVATEHGRAESRERSNSKRSLYKHHRGAAITHVCRSCVASSANGAPRHNHRDRKVVIQRISEHDSKGTKFASYSNHGSPPRSCCDGRRVCCLRR